MTFTIFGFQLIHLVSQKLNSFLAKLCPCTHMKLQWWNRQADENQVLAIKFSENSPCASLVSH